MTLELLVSHSDEKIVDCLRKGFEGRAGISVMHLQPDQLPRLDGLDAIYLTVMGAERFGARPIIHKAQVLRTKPADAEKGLPPYVVAGGVFKTDDPNDPRFQLSIIITSVLEAVNAFNLDQDQPIRSIGFWAEDLLIGSLDPLEVAQIVASLHGRS